MIKELAYTNIESMIIRLWL